MNSTRRASVPDTFVVYQGHHGDAGAARADVILPGAAYTEKSGTYVNTEGRVQRGFLAVYPPGEAREDWKILRAFSEMVGHTLPYDTLDALRARLEQVNPVFGRIGFLPRFGCSDQAGPAGDPAALSDAPFEPAIANYYQTDPISRASPTMAACTATFARHAAGRGGGIAAMRSFFFDTDIGLVILTFAEALALLVPLLIGVAYLTYAERKVLAAMQLRKGPNVVGPFGLLQPFADALKMIMKETIIPAGLQPAAVPDGADADLQPRDDRLGGDPGERRLGDRRHQCRHPLPVRDQFAWRLRHHHRRLGVQFEIRLPGRDAQRGADGELRSLDGLRHGLACCCASAA